MEIDHRPDCQLITVKTYGLCTCDFDERMARKEALSRGTQEQEAAADLADQ